MWFSAVPDSRLVKCEHGNKSEVSLIFLGKFAVDTVGGKGKTPLIGKKRKEKEKYPTFAKISFFFFLLPASA